jgi:hypothetical protein
MDLKDQNCIEKTNKGKMQKDTKWWSYIAIRYDKKPTHINKVLIGIKIFVGLWE